MSTENRYLLEDMKKYNATIDFSQYKNKSEEDVKTEFKEYYKSIMKITPIDLLTWCRVNEPPDTMIYKKGYWRQIMLLRDEINALFYEDYDNYKANPVLVINTHMTKSIVMPVYEINLKQYGVKMILRDNLYDWKVSVISEKELNIDFKNIFNESTEKIHSVYCEGFDESHVFDRYCDNKKNFTISISGDSKLYVFMWLLNDYLKNNKN